MNRVDTCHSCHHQIVWLEHVRTGNRAPIDFAPNERGNVIPLDRDGEQTILESAVTYRVLHKGESAPMPHHMPHHATCAAAAQWRGRGRAPRGVAA